MKKHDLLKSDTGIVRVLDIQTDRILIIDCIRRTMPIWVKPSILDSYSVCSIEALNEATGYADLLQADSSIKGIKCNVLMDGLEEGEYTTDFVCVKVNTLFQQGNA